MGTCVLVAVVVCLVRFGRQGMSMSCETVGQVQDMFLPSIDFVDIEAIGGLEIRCIRQYMIARDSIITAFDCILKKV